MQGDHQKAATVMQARDGIGLGQSDGGEDAEKLSSGYISGAPTGGSDR